MTTFGDIRSLAHRTPSRAHFQVLLEALHTSNAPREEVRGVWIPYLEGVLTAWPDDARACGQELTKVVEVQPVPWARLVRTLDYQGARLTKARVRALSRAEHLSHVTRLDLRASRITWPLIAQLAAQAPFERLKSLALRKANSSGIDEDAFPALLSAPMLAALEELELGGWSRFAGKHLEMVLEHMPLGALRALNLSGTNVSQSATNRLLARPEARELRELGLAKPTDLAELSSLRALEVLRAVIPERRATPLHEALGGMTRLRRLTLVLAPSDDDALREFARAEAYPALERLRLDGSFLTTEGTSALARATCFPRVEALSLRRCDLEDVSVLGQMRAWPSLKRLNLNHDTLVPGTWGRVANAPFYEQLTHLSANFAYRRDVTYAQEMVEVGLPPHLESLHVPLETSSELLDVLRAIPQDASFTTLNLPLYGHRNMERMSDEVVDALCTHPALGELRRLGLRLHNPTTPQAQRIYETFPALEMLLFGNAMTNALGASREEAEARGVTLQLYPEEMLDDDLW